MKAPETTLVVKDIAGYAALEREWNALADSIGTPFVRHEWFMASLQAFHGADSWVAVCLRDGAGLRAACVLVPRYAGILSFYEIAAVKRLGEWGGLLYRTETDLADLMREIVKLGRAVVLERLPADTAFDAVVRDAQWGPTLHFERTTSTAFRLPIRGTWDDYFASLPAARRKQLRRKQHQAEVIGPVSLRVVIPDEVTCEDSFDQFLNMEHAGPKGQDGRSIRANPDLWRFFAEMVRRSAALGLLRFYTLEIGGKTAAMQMTVEQQGTVWAFKIAYDPAFAKCTPGLLLDRLVLEHCFDRGLRAYEFLGKAEPWEAFWNPECRSFRSFYVFPMTARGLAGLGLRTAMSITRRLAQPAMHRAATGL